MVHPPQPGIQQSCRFCGAILRNHFFGQPNVCTQPQCQTQHAKIAAEEARQREITAMRHAADAMAAKAAGTIARARAEQPDPEAPLTLTMLPGNGRSTIPTPPDVRDAFIAHLDTCIEQAFAEPAPTERPADRKTLDAPEPPTTEALCTFCRGACCIMGREHNAFVDVHTIQIYRAAHPEISMAEARKAWIDKLPDETTEGGCVFQSNTGCTLPRSQRPDLCNRHYCLSNILAVAALERPGAGPAVAFTDGSEGPQRAGIPGPDGWEAAADPGTDADTEAASKDIARTYPLPTPGYG